MKFKSLTSGSNVQQGVASVTVNTGSDTGSTPVTFPKPFAAVPNVQLTFTGTGSIGSQTGFVLPLVTPSNAAITWAAMPAANTEFLGLAIHRHFNSSGIAWTGIILGFAVVVGAGAAGATLQIDFSTDSGATWTALTSTIPIDTTGLKTSAAAFPPGASNNTNIWYRVSGTGGNGIASPQFGAIGLSIRIGFASVWLQAQSITKTGFTCQVKHVQPITTNFTWSVQWTAQ